MINKETYLEGKDINTRNDRYQTTIRELFNEYGFSTPFRQINLNIKSADFVVGIMFDNVKNLLLANFAEYIRDFKNVAVSTCVTDECGDIVIHFTRNETFPEWSKRKSNEAKEAESRANAQKNREEKEQKKLRSRYEHFLQEKKFFDSIGYER